MYIPCPCKPGRSLSISSMEPSTQNYRLLMPALISRGRCSDRRTQDYSVGRSECRPCLLGPRQIGRQSAACASHVGSHETLAGAPSSARQAHSGNRVLHCCKHTVRRPSLRYFPFRLRCYGGAQNVAATAGLGSVEAPTLAGEARKTGGTFPGHVENIVCARIVVRSIANPVTGIRQRQAWLHVTSSRFHITLSHNTKRTKLHKHIDETTGVLQTSGEPITHLRLTLLVGAFAAQPTQARVVSSSRCVEQRSAYAIVA